MSTRAGKSATIVDVARDAGVSIKTVSRVLNHESGVHESTRAAVLQVVETLSYRPKQSARSLAGGRSFLIGLLYYDPSALFVAQVQQGATLRCRETGRHLVVESLHGEAPDLKQQVERMVQALRPDGMILTPPLCDNAQVLQALHDSGTPCVLISPERDRAGMPSVRIDELRAAEEITRLLIGLGHQRIAFVTGPPDQAASAPRLQGYLNAMQAHGLAVAPELIQPGLFNFESGLAAAQILLGQQPRPSAVFASSDDMALGVLVAAQRLGLSVPGELSVAGFDDIPAARLVWPALTTVRQPMAEMARVAVDLLLAPAVEADKSAPHLALHRILPHELVVRDSTRHITG